MVSNVQCFETASFLVWTVENKGFRKSFDHERAEKSVIHCYFHKRFLAFY